MDKTLEYYNSNANDFIGGTVDASVEELHNLFLKYIPEKSHILDLGCGSGRDSKSFLNKGHSVIAIDGSKELCKLASDYIGQEVINMTFEDIDFMDEFDGIWACASILHVPSDKLLSIFQKVSLALKVNGYLYVSFKYGDFEGERNGRYFTDLTEIALNYLLKPIKELEVLETTVTNDVRPGRDNEKWLNAIIRKQPV